MMSQSRCTLSVRGLDCPNEVETLRAALAGSPGIASTSGFDLINGLMTVDYAEGRDRPGSTGPADPRAGRDGGRRWSAGPRRRLPPPSWWSRHGRLVSTAGSGLALGLGLLVSWLGPRAGLDAATRERLARGCFGSWRSRSGGPGSTPGPSGA